MQERVRRLPTSLVLVSLAALLSAGALQAAPTGAPGLTYRERPAGPVTARLTEQVAVRVAPGEHAVATLPVRTEFGSPQTVAVVERRGRWLGVVTSALPNGEIGWIDGRAAAAKLRRSRCRSRSTSPAAPSSSSAAGALWPR